MKGLSGARPERCTPSRASFQSGRLPAHILTNLAGPSPRQKHAHFNSTGYYRRPVRPKRRHSAQHDRDCLRAPPWGLRHASGRKVGRGDGHTDPHPQGIIAQ
jgi:hypothetical protein